MTAHTSAHLRNTKGFARLSVQIARRFQRENDFSNDDVLVLVRSLNPVASREDVPNDTADYFDFNDAIREDVANWRRLGHEPFTARLDSHTGTTKELFHPGGQYLERLQSAIRIHGGLTKAPLRGRAHKLVAKRYLVDPKAIVLTQSAVSAEREVAATTSLPGVSSLPDDLPHKRACQLAKRNHLIPSAALSQRPNLAPDLPFLVDGRVPLLHPSVPSGVSSSCGSDKTTGTFADAQKVFDRSSNV
ncbi:hypothetical protein [Ancylobacter sp.]|uniref:hypothetical protein n=1 Tax=Ancylobacter sp. TaxID=1872567 RepID=UPI003BA98C75